MSLKTKEKQALSFIFNQKMILEMTESLTTVAGVMKFAGLKKPEKINDFHMDEKTFENALTKQYSQQKEGITLVRDFMFALQHQFYDEGIIIVNLPELFKGLNVCDTIEIERTIKKAEKIKTKVVVPANYLQLFKETMAKTYPRHMIVTGESIEKIDDLIFSFGKQLYENAKKKMYLQEKHTTSRIAIGKLESPIILGRDLPNYEWKMGTYFHLCKNF